MPADRLGGLANYMYMYSVYVFGSCVYNLVNIQVIVAYLNEL